MKEPGFRPEIVQFCGTVFGFYYENSTLKSSPQEVFYDF
jgi:uncharacterized membrane protein YpjA